MTSHEDGSADQPTVTLRTRPYRDGTHAPHLQLPVELSNPELADHHQLPSSHSPGLLFGAAQPPQARVPALFALGDTVTMSGSATVLQPSMVERPELVEARAASSSSYHQALTYVGTGSSLLDARLLIIHNVTSVRAARNRTTELKAALEHRKLKALTPYKHDAWATSLQRHNLLQRYPTLCHSIQSGFDAGIPELQWTYAPPNSASLDEFIEAYKDIEQKELGKGRYIGPCSQGEIEDLVGPFQTSPLSIISKPGKPGKFRAVHNFSSPHTPLLHTTSINSAIDANNFPCTWGTFNTVAFIISNLPPGSQASIRDVAEAYRTIPVKASQWPGLVIRLQGTDQFAINTCNNFGLTSAGGMYGELADAGADIFRKEGIGPISKWVDDHIFFRIQKQYLTEYNGMREQWHQNILITGGRRQDGSRIWFCGKAMEDGRLEEFDEDNSVPFQDLSPTTQYTYDDSDIDRISHHLGIPWEISKTIPFGAVVPYLGLTWDLDEKTVAIPDAKKKKYLACIGEWFQRQTHTLAQVQSLYGKLLHSCLVIREGRAYLTSLEAMLSISYNRPFIPRTPPHGTTQDLQWWARTLQKPNIFKDIPGPVSISDFGAYSDASSGIGIGIIIGDRWRAWRLLPGWKTDGREIGWAEAVGFEFLIRTICGFICEPHKQHVKVFGDNTGVVEGWWKGRSRNKPTNEIFRRIHEIEKARKITIHSRYVASKLNPADDPSRGIYSSRSLLLPPIPIPSQLQPFLVDFDTQPQLSEQQASKDGTFRIPLPKPERSHPTNEHLIANTRREQEEELCYLAENCHT